MGLQGLFQGVETSNLGGLRGCCWVGFEEGGCDAGGWEGWLADGVVGG